MQSACLSLGNYLKFAQDSQAKGDIDYPPLAAEMELVFEIVGLSGIREISRVAILTRVKPFPGEGAAIIIA